MAKKPTLNSIRAFEVAARHLSFTKAAKEIGVTPGAVSKQVLNLEDFIGALLFTRTSKGLELTLEGRELRENISPAFEILEDAFKRYSRRPLNSVKYRISTVASLASQFIIPRLAEFKKEIPHLNLELLTSDRLLDLSKEEVDIAIRFGRGNWEGTINTKLTEGILIPVCSPKIFKEKNDLSVSEIINSQTRIQIFSFNEWQIWEEQTSCQFKQKMDYIYLEHFLVAIQAVISGQGIALLPEILIRENIKNGDIVQFSDDAVEVEDTFYIVQPNRKNNNQKTPAVIDWLLKSSNC